MFSSLMILQALFDLCKKGALQQDIKRVKIDQRMSRFFYSSVPIAKMFIAIRNGAGREKYKSVCIFISANKLACQVLQYVV